MLTLTIDPAMLPIPEPLHVFVNECGAFLADDDDENPRPIADDLCAFLEWVAQSPQHRQAVALRRAANALRACGVRVVDLGRAAGELRRAADPDGRGAALDAPLLERAQQFRLAAEEKELLRAAYAWA